jgi:uncharacterized protein YbaP (TraB family)
VGAEGRRGALRGWLYGTIHVCDAACFPLPAPVREALAAADGLALELDPADPSSGRRWPGPACCRRSAGWMSPAARAAPAPCRGAGGGRGGGRSAQRLQPWLLGTLMTLQAARLAGFHTEQGVDLWLATEARARGLPLVALETVERQIAALSAGRRGAAGEPRRGDRAHRTAVRPPYFAAMLAAWRRGDPAALDHLLRDEMASPGMAPLLADLLDQRNAEMLEAITARLQPGQRPSSRWAPATWAARRACSICSRSGLAAGAGGGGG